MSHIELQNIRHRTMNQNRGLEPEAEETPANYELHTEDEETVPLSPARRKKRPDIFRDESGGDDDDEGSYEEREMTLQELMYSSSSFYAIVVPGELENSVSFTMNRER